MYESWWLAQHLRGSHTAPWAGGLRSSTSKFPGDTEAAGLGTYRNIAPPNETIRCFLGYFLYIILINYLFNELTYLYSFIYSRLALN